MKPTVTWIVLANARVVRVLANRGPGKGIVALSGMTWTAEDAKEPRDHAGVGHSIAGPGVAAVEQSDLHLQAETRFAREVCAKLAEALDKSEYDRLVIFAGPHMLGLLRAHLDDRVRQVTIGEVPKDLSAQSLEAVHAHLGEVLAV